MLARIFFILLWISLFLDARPASAKPAPVVSGVLSIVPGLGQVANGNYLEGLGYFSVSVGGILIPNKFTQHIGLQTYLYQYYDAWRDAGGKPSQEQNWFQNYIGTYNPLNAIDWIGTPALGIVAVAEGGNRPMHSRLSESIIFGTFSGWGEEAFFRGFLFPVLSFGSNSFWMKSVGALTSSVLFSLVNKGIGTFSVIEVAQGLLFCTQTHINNYNLRKSMFTHAWWNIIADIKNGSRVGGVAIPDTYRLGLGYNFVF